MFEKFEINLIKLEISIENTRKIFRKSKKVSIKFSFFQIKSALIDIFISGIDTDRNHSESASHCPPKGFGRTCFSCPYARYSPD